MKRSLFAFLLFFAFLLSPKSSFAQSISNINIGPSLDISRFSAYTMTADIADYPTTSPVTINLTPINGDSSSYWDYRADGTPESEDLTFNMTYLSGTTWQKTSIYPDYIYPEIYFVPSSVSWGNTPSNINIRRNQYQLLHLQNPFTMTGDMNFWVEVNTTPNSLVNSSDLEVYLVAKNKNVSFFQSDWRNSPDVQLVGTLNKASTYHHTHSVNSSHHLIAITPNGDGTIGAKNIDISTDFWIILYSSSPNVSRGWDLKYFDSSLCTQDNRWYLGNQTGWTTTYQSGCPDSHIHLVRRNIENLDGLTATVYADSVSQDASFYYAPLPNLPPNSTNFTNPTTGAYTDTINITWSAASDPNGDQITYKIDLLDSAGDTYQNLSTGTTATTLSFDTNSVPDADYSLRGQVCDLEYCVNFNSTTFSINNTATQIYTLNSISLTSNNSNNSLAITGNTVTLSFTASGEIQTPNVTFYSAGYPITNSNTTTNPSGNNWLSSFLVDPDDTNGEVSFVISSNLLDRNFYQSTDSSYVLINNPAPTATPTQNPSVQSNDSINSSQNSSPPSCNQSPPSNAPDLFQIDVSSTNATIYYSPVTKNVTAYYLAFGTESQKALHGAMIEQGESSGVLSFDVSYLKPNTTYYFTIRGQNGCQTGDWSTELKIKTTNSENKKISFYKYGKIKSTPIYQTISSFFSKDSPTKPKPNQETPTTKPQPSNLPESKPEDQNNSNSNNVQEEKKKRCFLFWCW